MYFGETDIAKLIRPFFKLFVVNMLNPLKLMIVFTVFYNSVRNSKITQRFSILKIN